MSQNLELIFPSDQPIKIMLKVIPGIADFTLFLVVNMEHFGKCTAHSYIFKISNAFFKILY